MVKLATKVGEKTTGKADPDGENRTANLPRPSMPTYYHIPKILLTTCPMVPEQ